MKPIADSSAAVPKKTEVSDTTKATASRKQAQNKISDENGNGIDDRLETAAHGRQKGRDKFIDADGDGICDGREAGLGFQRRGLSGFTRGSGDRGKQKRSGGGR